MHQQFHTHIFNERLDVTQASAVKKELCRLVEGQGSIAADMSRVQRIDTAGFQVLLAAKRRVEERGFKWQWRAPSEAFVSAARIIGLAGPLGLDGDDS